MLQLVHSVIYGGGGMWYNIQIMEDVQKYNGQPLVTFNTVDDTILNAVKIMSKVTHLRVAQPFDTFPLLKFPNLAYFYSSDPPPITFVNEVLAQFAAGAPIFSVYIEHGMVENLDVVRGLVDLCSGHAVKVQKTPKSEGYEILLNGSTRTVRFKIPYLSMIQLILREDILDITDKAEWALLPDRNDFTRTLRLHVPVTTDVDVSKKFSCLKTIQVMRFMVRVIESLVEFPNVPHIAFMNTIDQYSINNVAHDIKKLFPNCHGPKPRFSLRVEQKNINDNYNVSVICGDRKLTFHAIDEKVMPDLYRWMPHVR